MDLERHRERAEAFSQAIARERYLGRAGLKEKVNYIPIYEEFRDLFRLEALEEIRRAKEDARGEEKDRLKLLLEGATLGYLSDHTKEIRETADNFEACARVSLPDGSTLPYRASAVRLLNEPYRERREAIESAREKVVDEKNRLLRPLHEAFHRLACELGYKGYLEMMEGLKPFSLSPLREAMEVFLKATERLYQETLEKALFERLGIDPGDARRHDLARLFRGEEFDPFFPGERLFSAIGTWVKEMGLHLDAEGRVLFDCEARPAKSPRAFCVTIRVPEEVILVIHPRGGIEDYMSFLHELGHALHFAWTRPGLSYEYRRLGDPSVTEGFAMLFDHLLLNGAWLEQALAIEGARPLLRQRYLHELYMLRRYAAKIDYELDLHRGPNLAGKEELYAKRLTTATRARYSPVHFLEDVDPHFYCANYLRAWMFQGQLSSYLSRAFGETWFLDPRSGDLLKSLWAEGQREDAEGLLRRLGLEGLSLDPLITSIRRHLSSK